MTPREPDVMTQKFRESQAQQRQALAEFRATSLDLLRAVLEVAVLPVVLRARIERFLKESEGT